MATSPNTDSRSRISVGLTLALFLAAIVCANIWRPAAAAGSVELHDPADVTLGVWPGKPVVAPTLGRSETAGKPGSAVQALDPQALQQQARLKQTQPGL